MVEAPARFFQILAESLEDGKFVKLTLSEYRGAESGLRNVYARLVELREGRKLSLLARYATRDVTTNVTLADAVAAIERQLATGFARAHLFTTHGDWQLQVERSGTAKLRARRTTFTLPPSPEHDRKKAHPLAAAPFLTALGVTTSRGAPRPGMADKLRQIQRFAEILGHLVEDSPLLDRRELRVVDMGAGKGYLTFAMAEFFRARGVSAEVLGVERREDLIELTNRVAKEMGFVHLRFVRGAIGETAIDPPADLLVALHACDTATDDALHQGITTGASLILAAPCCHHEIRTQLAPPEVLSEVLRHGILCAREAELLTDGVRALLLEMHGYATSVFEFISTEHTSKNLMIAARLRLQPLDPAPLRARLRALLSFYGIREQRLAGLLGEV